MPLSALAAASLAAATLSPPAPPADESGAISPPPAPARPPFRPFRFDEDYSFLADPARRTHPLDPIKYIALSDEDPQTYLSLGGELRTRYEYFDEPGFGLRGQDRDDYLLQRIFLHGDLHVGERFRTFVQLVSAFQEGEESPPSPLQDDVLDVQQAFADVHFGDGPGDGLRLRLGRQELAFGTLRLVTARESTNVRLAFDGVRATWRDEGVTIDGFLVRPVELERGIYNDGQNDGQTFWGVYATLPIPQLAGANLDAYYLGLLRDEAQFAQGIDDESRHSVGARFWGRDGGWDYDIEALVQAGKFGEADIFAWTIASHIGYTFHGVPWTPRLGLKANIASGDSDPADNRLGTFNPLFPKQAYFSELNLFAPSNFFDFQPNIELRPAENLVVTAGYDIYFRYSVDDAVYSPGRIGIPANASDDRYVGSTLQVQVDWTVSRNVSISAICARLFRGDVVTDAGGEDTSLVAAWITIRF